jgi:RNA polymerase sigma-70 factor (ECF subfamily)
VQIAVNEARNRRRAAGRRARLALELAGAPEGGTERPTEAQALAGDEHARLIAAVEKPSDDDQLVIAARYFLGLSEAETAAALGLRRGTVKSRLSRALGRLRVRLGEGSTRTTSSRCDCTPLAWRSRLRRRRTSQRR